MPVNSSSEYSNKSQHVDIHNDESVKKLCLHSFSEGVRLGRELQRDDDGERLTRYKARMRAEEVLLRKKYSEEMEFLQSELSALRDELLATQVAYEEIVRSVASASGSGQWQSRFHSNSSAGQPERLDVLTEDLLNYAQNDEDDFDTLQQVLFMEDEIDKLVDDENQSRSTQVITFDYSAAPNSNIESPSSDWSDSDTPGPNNKADNEGRTPRKRSAPQTHLLDRRKGPRIRATEAKEAPEFYVDASAFGIGFILKEKWLAWRFTAAHPLLPRGPDGKIIMSWAELIAVEMGIRTVISAGFRDVAVTVHSDNQGVVMALKSGKWTKKYGLEETVKDILGLCRGAGLSLTMKWIRTTDNPADDPSRGFYPPAESSFEYRPVIPPKMYGLVQDVGQGTS